jgi:delta(3,5)-delta(2,4)-dienoyl-CoA isomerase
MALACDVRYCTADARFCIKEVDLAITADIGTLQRLPKIVGHGVATELALTAREVTSDEALRIGLVSGVSPSAEALETRVAQVAAAVAAKSPLAIQGTKAAMVHARDHSVPEGLEYVAMMNAARLTSSDLTEAMGAKFGRRKPVFAKL